MRKILKDYGIAIGAAIVTALLVRGFVFEAFRVPTDVMKPTLLSGDYIFASKSGYGRADRVPARGEIVIFRSPEGRPGSYIKRVVGLPGESVAVRGGRLVIGGEQIQFEPDARDASCGVERHADASYGICLEPPLLADQSAILVPKGQVFVIGDNRNNAASRERPGLVPIHFLTAGARWIWLSVEPRTENDSFAWLPDFRLDRMFVPVR